MPRTLLAPHYISTLDLILVDLCYTARCRFHYLAASTKDVSSSSYNQTISFFISNFVSRYYLSYYYKENRNILPMAKTSLPPGFRFHPTDVELTVYYLKRKLLGKHLRCNAITEIDLYKFAPWDLPGIGPELFHLISFSLGAKRIGTVASIAVLFTSLAVLILLYIYIWL